MIDLCTLGTGGAIPLPDRALSSLYVRTGGHALLVDCGEGTQTQIRRLGWGFRCIEGVLLTHYHADHCGGLPGFLLSMAKTGRTEPLHIWGPAGLHRMIGAVRVFAPALPYPLELHELPMQVSVFEVCSLQVTAFPLDHGVPCLGYHFELKRGGAFDPDRARALDVPVTLWKLLQQGQTVQLPDGTPVEPAQVMGGARRSLRFLYATDTRPVPEIAALGTEADLLILEGMYGTEEKREQALHNHHMLYAEAAELAAAARAKQLLLTHFSNCIEDPLLDLPEAQRVFEHTQAADDLMTLTLHWEGR